MKKKVTKSLVLLETDAFNGKISNESPMAKALIGKSLKDEVRVPLPNGGEINVKIVNIK